VDLTPEQLRVLGCLVEKQLATPQQYPLSLNALIAACNQSTNREPVVDYGEDDVRGALAGLRDHALVKTFYATGSRTPKYGHLLEDFFELGAEHTAVLAILLLRGPQTPGELRARAERLFAFAGQAEIEAALAALAEHPYGPLVRRLERRPGQKEARHVHLLGGEPADVEPEPVDGSDRRPSSSATVEELGRLRAEVDDLRSRLEALERG
jgi:uncharacterized protein YceH (UPF0502 family)